MAGTVASVGSSQCSACLYGNYADEAGLSECKVRACVVYDLID